MAGLTGRENQLTGSSPAAGSSGWRSAVPSSIDPRAAVPGRANGRRGSGLAAQVLDDDPRAGERGRHDLRDDPLPGRGRARQPDRDDPQRRPAGAGLTGRAEARLAPGHAGERASQMPRSRRSNCWRGSRASATWRCTAPTSTCCWTPTGCPSGGIDRRASGGWHRRQAVRQIEPTLEDVFISLIGTERHHVWAVHSQVAERPGPCL